MATWLRKTEVIHPTRPLPGSEFDPGLWFLPVGCSPEPGVARPEMRWRSCMARGTLGQHRDRRNARYVRNVA